MDGFNKQNGELSGFDSVNGKETPDTGNGYTVTPEGGYYTKSREDIIQDEVVSSDTAYTAEPVGDVKNAESAQQTPPPKHDFFPNGE